MLTLSSITKYFGGLAALSNVSLSVSQGDITAVIGPNGAGKTTLFSIIAGTLKPSAGRIHLRDQEITGLGPARICRLGICRTFQVVRPFPELTVRDHLVAAAHFGGGRGNEKQIDPLLKLTGLKTKAHWPAKTLTLAECRRLEVARALATGASILLLDETMSGLSPEETMEAIGLLRRVRDEGRTIFLIEHLLAAVTDLCDRTVVLDHGKVIADGPPGRVLASEVVKSAYLGQ